MTGAATAPAVDHAVVTRWDADDAVTHLYVAHYRSLVRTAALVLRDVATAEEVTQDAFVTMHAHWHRLRDPEKALAYLRRSVVNGARSALRRRAVATKHLPGQWVPGDAASAEHAVLALAARDEVVRALHALPLRQRETLVLRYYADLSEAEIAAAMGISRGAVKSHASRGMAALRDVLEQSR